MIRSLKYGKANDVPTGYLTDINRIINALWDNKIIVTPRQAYDMWSEYSDTYCAGWLMLDTYTDQEIYMALTESPDDWEE